MSLEHTVTLESKTAIKKQLVRYEKDSAAKLNRLPTNSQNEAIWASVRVKSTMEWNTADVSYLNLWAYSNAFKKRWLGGLWKTFMLKKGKESSIYVASCTKPEALSKQIVDEGKFLFMNNDSC